MQIVRRHIPTILSTLLFATLLVACEETVTDTTIEFPYVEELVVQGFLTAGGEGDTLFISRTLPPLERWTIERAAVTDAEVAVTVDGSVLSFRHIRNGLYVPDGWRAELGKSYDLQVTKGSLNVRATATMPRSVPHDISFRLDTLVGECEVYDVDGPSTTGDLVNGLLSFSAEGDDPALYEIRYDLVVRFSEFPYDDTLSITDKDQLLYGLEQTGNRFTGTFRYDCLDPQGNTKLWYKADTLIIRALSNDPAYLLYRDGNDIGEDPFGPSLADRQWNVTGDGFGWFFGRTVIRDTIAGL